MTVKTVVDDVKAAQQSPSMDSDPSLYRSILCTVNDNRFSFVLFMWHLCILWAPVCEGEHMRCSSDGGQRARLGSIFVH